MIDGPEFTLKSGRLVLRPVVVEDADGPYQYWMNDPVVTRHLEARFAVHDPENIRRFIRETSANDKFLFLAICLAETGEHIGNIKLGPIVQPHSHADIGLIIGEQRCWGKGYATEAIRLVTQYAFTTLGLHKLTAGCYSSNPESARAFLKVGFLVEGTRRSHYLQNGVYVDAILLGMINPDESAGDCK